MPSLYEDDNGVIRALVDRLGYEVVVTPAAA
jgi:hypothetical protein